MKYDAHQIEQRWRTFWEERAIFKFDAQSDGPLYVVDTPPSLCFR